MPSLEDGHTTTASSRPRGWDADGGGIVGPMIPYLLPILIGYTGGRIVYDDPRRCRRRRGMGVIATMGAIIAAATPSRCSSAR